MRRTSSLRRGSELAWSHAIRDENAIPMAKPPASVSTPPFCDTDGLRRGLRTALGLEPSIIGSPPPRDPHPHTQPRLRNMDRCGCCNCRLHTAQFDRCEIPQRTAILTRPCKAVRSTTFGTGRGTVTMSTDSQTRPGRGLNKARAGIQLEQGAGDEARPLIKSACGPGSEIGEGTRFLPWLSSRQPHCDTAALASPARSRQVVAFCTPPNVSVRSKWKCCWR